MSKLISPYKNLIQFSKIQLQPYHLNSDIELNMETILKENVENKCNKYGYIDKVYKIQSYEEGLLKKENLSGTVDFNITYECKMCFPIENTIIIAKLIAINQELVMASNGAIIIFIPKNNIDKNIWDIGNTFINKLTDKELKKNDLVKILINKIKINQNDKQIKCIGILLDEPNEKEVKDFYFQKDENTLSEDNNFII